MTYRISREALSDIEEIRDYVEHRMENPAGADVVEAYLFQAFERIGCNPHRCGGRSRLELTSRPVKFLTVKKYVVLYDDRAEPATIVGVVGGRQDLSRFLTTDPRFSDAPDEA